MGGNTLSNPKYNPPPPLGDLTTKVLIKDPLNVAGSRNSERVSLRLRMRGATLDDARVELRRRERFGVGVQQ